MTSRQCTPVTSCRAGSCGGAPGVDGYMPGYPARVPSTGTLQDLFTLDRLTALKSQITSKLITYKVEAQPRPLNLGLPTSVDRSPDLGYLGLPTSVTTVLPR